MGQTEKSAIGHNVLLLRQTTRDIYMHYHIDMITNGMTFAEPVGGTGVFNVQEIVYLAEINNW